MSVTDSRPGSTRFQAPIHSGKLLNGVPTSTVSTSYFTITARAGAVKYSRKMKNSDQVTD
ncbi:hypothetical protein D9M68_908320 [compost metagenome]